MSSTPNYGYETTLEASALQMVDRDIKRVEEKADANTANKVDKREGYGLISDDKNEQISLNHSRIQCLDGRMDRAEADIASRYTKDEADCKLAAKADRCALEKHLIDPNAHEDLFDGKVDKKEGCRLFCEGDERRLDEIEEELEKKVNMGTPEIHDLILAEDIRYYRKSTVAKSPNGLVTINAELTGELTGGKLLAVLPEEFRPDTDMERIAFYHGGLDAPMAALVFVYMNGEIRVQSSRLSGQDKVFFSLNYYV